MKKLIFTVTTDLNNDQRMQRICSSLQCNGYDVLLVGRKKNKSVSLNNKPYNQKRLHCYFNTTILFYFEYNIRLFLFLLFARFDVISSVDLDTVLPGYLVARLKRKKIVFDSHEYFTELPELSGKPLKKACWNGIANYCLPKIKTAYTVNESLAKIFKEKYNVEYKFIRSITDQRGQSFEKVRQVPKLILYQGALNIGRGLETAIKAMQYIDGAILELAGDGDIKEELKMLVEQHGLNEKVRFLGQLSPDKLRVKTHQAYLGLNLLENNSLNYYYSLANKFFDYMHAEVPSINMNFPEYEQIITQYKVGLLLDKLDEVELASNINEIIKSPEKHMELSNQAKLAKEVYNWQSEEKKLIEIYNRIT